jgi:Flp pilus assembly protein TadD
MHTGMGQSFDLATHTKSSARFDGNTAVYDSSVNMWYAPFWVGDSLYIREFRLDNKDTIYKREQRVDYIIGSGQHTNSHLFRINGFMYQAPLTWYAQQENWDLPPGFETHNSRFSRMVDVECISCHNAMPVMEAVSDRRFTFVGNGIDCERCHGPGSAHVNYIQWHPKNREPQHGKYIINPVKLEMDRLIDVCQRCHLQGNNVLKPGKKFTDFRPGMKLSDVFEIYLPEYDGNENTFNMANHAQRLQKSKCFIATNKKGNAKGLTCITCHNPHVSVSQTKTSVFNTACNGCHQKKGCTIHKQEMLKAGSNCVSCHMPLTGTLDIPHVSVHDHYIRKPSEKTAEKGKLKGLYCVNNPHPEKAQLASAYLSYYEKFEANPLYREKAFELLKEINNPVLWIHYHYQIQDFGAIIKKVSSLENQNPDAMTCYRIATAYKQQSNFAGAEDWYFKALELEKGYVEFYVDYAAVLLRTKKPDEAERLLKKAEKLFPNLEKVHSGLGYIAFLGGDYARAKTLYKKALSLNPDHIITLENMAQLYVVVNDKKAAAVYLKRILKINPKHEKALSLMAVD